MCVVSMIGDHYDTWLPKKYPDTFPHWPVLPHTQDVSRQEFDALKKDVEEMKDLLRRAKDYDARNNEPDCEIEEKMALLKRIAELVGIDLNDVIGK